MTVDFKVHYISGNPYAASLKIMVDGLAAYAQEVRDGTFPGREHQFGIPREEIDRLLKMLG